MKTNNVTSAEKRDDGSIELTITDPLAGTAERKRYAAIRGGISLPTSKAPAYFCIVAQEYVAPPVMPLMRGEKAPAGSRVLLAEFESKSLSLSFFFSAIIDNAEQFMCSKFYVEMPEDRRNSGYLNDFRIFSRERDSDVYLSDAYDVDNFLLGVSRIKDGIDKSELCVPDDSIVMAQLQSITQEDLDNSPEEFFYAINALRHVIGSYYRYAPIVRSAKRQRRPVANWRVI